MDHVRLRPERPRHVWAYDFVEEITHDGRKIRMLNSVDEFTRECLAIKVAHKLNSMNIIETLADLFMTHGVPEHIRSDNGPEFIAQAVKDWLAAVGAKTAYIARRCEASLRDDAAPGRMAMWKASMAVFATSFCGIMEQAHQLRPWR